MDKAAMIALADSIDACVADALRPEPVPPNDPLLHLNPDHRVVSLANGLRAISAALRAIAGGV